MVFGSIHRKNHRECIPSYIEVLKRDKYDAATCTLLPIIQRHIYFNMINIIHLALIVS